MSLAVLHDIHDRQVDWQGKSPTFARLVTAAAALQTVVDVTGSGVAVVGICASATRQARAVITVDGAVLEDYADAALARAVNDGFRVYGSGGFNFPPLGNWGVQWNSSTGGTLLPTPLIGFRTSFRYQISTSSGGDIIGVAVVIA